MPGLRAHLSRGCRLGREEAAPSDQPGDLYPLRVMQIGVQVRIRYRGLSAVPCNSVADKAVVIPGLIRNPEKSSGSQLSPA
jgi:hypothetical protein